MKKTVILLAILGLLLVPAILAATNSFGANSFEADAGTDTELAPWIMHAESRHVSEGLVVEGHIRGTEVPVIVYIDPAEPESGSGDIPL